jgi:hypothetical protein
VGFAEKLSGGEWETAIKTEVGGQRTEDRGRRTEGRGREIKKVRKLEDERVRNWGSEDKRQKLEIRSQICRVDELFHH